MAAAESGKRGSLKKLISQILELQTSLQRRFARGALKEQYVTFCEFHLLVDIANSVNVGFHKLRANEYFHSRKIKKETYGLADSTSKLYATNSSDEICRQTFLTFATGEFNSQDTHGVASLRATLNAK